MRLSFKPVISFFVLVGFASGIYLANLFFQPPQVAYGEATYWDGGGDGSSWSDPLNWSNDVVPTETSDVVIDADTTVNIGQHLIDAIAHWKLNESSGNSLEDSSGNNYGATAYGTSITAGKMGNGRRTESTSDYITFPEVSMAGDWTISAWIEFPTAVNTTRTLIARSGGTYHHILVDADGNLATYNGSWYLSGYNINDLSEGWHHLVAVGSGSSTYFYIDGVLVGTSASKVTQPASIIGNHSPNGSQYFGGFDDVRIYDQPMGLAQISELYNNGSGTETSDFALRSSTINSLTLGNSSTPSASILNFTYDAIGGTPLIIDDGDLTIHPGATLQHSPGNSGVVGTVSIDVQTGNANIDGSVNLNGRGYAGNNGPGKGLNNGDGAGGGGHGGDGGYGADGVGGSAYGSIKEPVTLGSGGGTDSGAGGAGGGAMKLVVSGETTINGNITSNGNNGSAAYYGSGGGGAGGAIWIDTGVLSGSGTVAANGGSGGNINSARDGGGGAGGRIALYYTTDNSSLTTTTNVGTGHDSARFGGAGTIFTMQVGDTDGSLLVSAGTSAYEYQYRAKTPLGEIFLDNLTVSNYGYVISEDNINISQTLTINSNGVYRTAAQGNTTYGSLAWGDGMIVDDGGGFSLFSGGDLHVESDNVLYAHTERTFGNIIIDGTVLHGMNSSAETYKINLSSTADFTLNGTIDLSGRGYAQNNGPGTGFNSGDGAGGAGHGGAGGNGADGAGGPSYGSLTEPVTLGSGGRSDSGSGGRGGGAIKLSVGGTLVVNGGINVNGLNGGSSYYGSGGGGAGGSIWIETLSLSGGGSLSANGGNGGDTGNRARDGGGGGGGRIAVYYTSNNSTINMTANGGSGHDSAQPGETGTILTQAPPSSGQPTNFAQLSDGSGYISFDVEITDPDDHQTRLKVEYSSDNGSSWHSAEIASATSSAGTVDIDNESEFQVGAQDLIDTDYGTQTATIYWDTKSENNGNGSLDNFSASDLQIRVTVMDEYGAEGDAQTSVNFSLDNIKPESPGELMTDAFDGTSVSLSWTASSDNNFSHYEIWYSTIELDTENRTGSAQKWDGAHDSNMNSAVNTSTTITNLTPPIYYFKLWAVDTMGNESATPLYSQILNQDPESPIIPASSSYINGQFTNIAQPALSFVLNDADENEQLKYRIQVDGSVEFSSPVIDYESGYGEEGVRSFTVGQAVGDGNYSVGAETQGLVEGSYYWRIMNTDDQDQYSGWTVAEGNPSFTLDTTQPTNASGLSMRRSQETGVIVDDSEEIWSSNPAPYFAWTGATDDQQLKGYCLYLGVEQEGDPASAKGLLGSSPISTTGSSCGFITADLNIDFANSALRGDSWLTSSSEPYYFKIKAIDSANNIYDGESLDFRFYFDNTGPTNVSAISAANGSFSSVTDMYFYWPTSGAHAATDPSGSLLGFQYAFNDTDTWYGLETDESTGVEYVTLDYPQPFYLPASLEEKMMIGQNTIYFRVVDRAGNFSNYRTALVQYGGGAPAFGEEDVVSVTPAESTENNFAVSWPEAQAVEGKSVEAYYYMVNTQPPATYNTLTSNAAAYRATTATSLSARSLPGARRGVNTIYVVAVDDQNTYSPSHAISGNFTLNSTQPDSPTGLILADNSIKSVGLWRVSLAWEEPEYQGTGDLTYVIERSADGSSWENVGTTKGLAHVDTVPESKQYYWRVGAQDNSDQSQAAPSFTNAVTTTPKGAYETPPTLTSGPAASSITTKKATVTWTTSRTADSKVSFGPRPGEYYEEQPLKSDHVTDHIISLNNLKAGTTYYYKAKWTDEDGNTGESEEKSLTTAPAPFAQDIAIRNLGISSAMLEFTTSNASGVKLYYGTSTDFGGLREIATSNESSSYSVELTELQDNTRYYFKINTLDAEGEEYEGTILDFTTIPRPLISNVSIEQVRDAAQPTLRVDWNSNTPISSIVTFHPAGSPELAKDVVDIEQLQGAHSLTLRGLFPDMDYVLVVRGVDALGNEATSGSINFTTATDTRPPAIADVYIEGSTIPVVNSTAQESTAQLVVSWNTDEPATSQVEYGDGTGESYTQISGEDQSLKYNHSVIISGLTPSKVYHLRAISNDEAGNESKSEDQVAITPKVTDNAFDLVIMNLREVFSFLSGL